MNFDEKVKLQETDAKLFKDTIESLDELFYDSTYKQIKQDVENGDKTEEDIDKEIQKYWDELSFQNPLVTRNLDTDANLEIVTQYIESLVKIRRLVLLQSISSLDNDLNDSNIEIMNLINKRDTLVFEEISKLSTINGKLSENSGLQGTDYQNLEKIQDILSKIKLLRGDEKNSIDVDNYEAHEIHEKYKRIVTKNMMLSHFVNDLISSLSSVDIFKDEALTQMLMDCNDYSNYDLL